MVKCLLGLCCSVAIASWLAVSPAAGATGWPTLAVNYTADAVDARPGDGLCGTQSGRCTLRAAVQEANASRGPQRIVLPPGRYPLQLAGPGEDAAAGGDLDLTDRLRIRGAGSRRTVVEGGGVDRVFDVGLGVRAGLARLGISGGVAAGEVAGGGILNKGLLSVRRVLIARNVAENGGGIGNVPEAKLVIARSRVARNEARGNAGGIGGFGTIMLRQTRVRFNRAGVEAGGVGGPARYTLARSTISENEAGGQGGGIAIPTGGALTIRRSRVKRNVAQLNGGGIAAAVPLTLHRSSVRANRTHASGGAMLAAGGTISRSIISGNTASASSGFGGGVLNVGPMKVSNSAVRENTAWLGGGAANFETLTLARTKVTGNLARTLGGVFGGGGIGNAGTLKAARSTINGNRALGTGGGIGSSGLVTLDASTVSRNRAGELGGGVGSAGGLTATNSTISGNASGGSGGGVAFVGASMSLRNVTIALNSADSEGDGTGAGGGVYNLAGDATIAEALIAGNSAAEGPDCSGAFVPRGYNLIGDPAGCTPLGEGDGLISGQAAGLGPLAANGGPTATHALLAGSPAIDSGDLEPSSADPSSCMPVDQRRAPRPLDGDGDGMPRCDLGAFERRPAP